MRRKLYSVIETRAAAHKWYQVLYDLVMVVVILISLVPLAFKSQPPVLDAIDYAAFLVFVLDYVLRLATADYAMPQYGKAAFLVYPFTPMALIDLFSILPYISMLHNSLRLLRILRLVRTLRVFKLFRYSKSVDITLNVLKKQKSALLAVFTIAVGYIFISALVVFNVEPYTFDNFMEAIYWSTISLTTVGYGDVYPVSDLGQMLTVVSSVLGIGVVALPTGIITAGYMTELLHDGEEGTDGA